MGKCKFCGKDAGLLRYRHAECEQRHLQGLQQIAAMLQQCFERHEDFYLHEAAIRQVCANSFITPEELHATYCQAFDQAVERYLDNGLIDAPEEASVRRFWQFTGLNQDALNASGSLERVFQAKVLQQILNGQTPTPPITLQQPLPIMFARDEHLLWLFRDITLQQQKVRREYRGRSSGWSMRVCRGVYYRTGGFRGHPVETTYIDTVATGIVALTDRNLYFHSPQKALKVPFIKIISLEPYSDGLGVQMAGASAKPLFLRGLNSWFCYNAISNLRP